MRQIVKIAEDKENNQALYEHRENGFPTGCLVVGKNNDDPVEGNGKWNIEDFIKRREAEGWK